MAKRTSSEPVKTPRPARATTTAKGKAPKKPARIWEYIKKADLQDKAKRT